MPHKCLLIPISNASLAQGRGGQVVRSWLRFPFQCSPAALLQAQRTPNPRFHDGRRCAIQVLAGGGMGARFAGLLNGITKASVNRRRGRSNREFQSQVCIRCRQVGPLGGGDICDVQAVVNVQLGDKAGNGQVATMDLGRCRAHLN